MIVKPNDIADVRLTRSDGQVLSLADNGMGILELKGVDAPVVEIFEEKNAVGDGSIITGQRVGARSIQIKLKSRVRGLSDYQRDAFSTFLNPLYTFDALILYGNRQRTARECRLKALSIPTGNLYAPMEMNFTLFCPSGYLDGGGMHGQDINSVIGCFGFPYVSVAGKGMNYSVLNYQKNIQINNTGDSPTYIRAVLNVTGADTVLNPSVTCNGYTVKVLTGLNAGDVLEIDAEKYTVRKNGVNALHLLDIDSRLSHLRMDQGNNVISFDADDHDNQLSVRIFYALRYNGM